MSGPFWTPDEEGYLRGVWGHAELGEIAKYLKVRSAQAIRHKAEALGLPLLQEARAKAKYAQGPETAQGAIQELFDIAMKEWGRVEPIIKKPFPDRKTRWGLHEAGLQLSDIHLGLKVDPELTGGLGAYDVDIAVRRALKLRDSVVEITQMHQEVQTLKRLNVFALGDELEGAGNIYPGQPFHLDSSLYKQWVVCGEMLVSLLQGLLTVYDTIVVYKVKGNHGRLTNKPDAGHPEDNFELLLWKYIQARFQHEPRMKIGIWSSWFAIANRLGWNFYLAHGEQVLPWCVDTETEILTQRGWLHHDELKVGDLTPGLNEQGVLEWDPVTAVNEFPARPYRMVHCTGDESVDMLMTENHRWVKRLNGERFDIAGNIRSHQRAIVLCPFGQADEHNRPLEHLAAVVGWYLTEGWDCGTSGRLGISQSHEVNADFCEGIRKALWGAGLASRESQRGKMTIWELPKAAAQRVREWAPGKQARWDILALWPQPALKALWKAMLQGDGTWKGRVNIFSQVDKQRADFFQALCVRLGKFATMRHEEDRIWRVSVHGGRGMKRTTRRKMVRPQRLTLEIPVWCPSTKSGTWVARRNGKVFLTGNSPYAAKGAFNVKLRLNSLFEQKIHYCLFAHHHTPLEIARELEGAILFNGSWVGPAEYALRSLYEANLPSQNFFLVTPRYGMRALDKIRLADLKDVRDVKVDEE